MSQWADFSWADPMFANADETILRKAPASVENAYANKAGGFTRFPGLASFVSLPGQGRCIPYRWRSYLIVATQAGRVYRASQSGVASDVTGTPLTGGKRPVFAATDDNRLVIATGGPLVSLSSGQTELLSEQAPESTHVAYVDGYLIAIEPGTGRFRYCDPGEYTVWNDLSIFSADGKPDDLVATVVTPFRELLLAGPESIEQFERLQSGTRPFFRRWATGEGLAQPYTLVADTNGTYGVNLRNEFVKFQAQVSREQSEDVAVVLEDVTDWEGAWAATLAIDGQRFIVLQVPNAVCSWNQAKGVTFLFDYRTKKWSFLWGWDMTAGVPARWPGWGIDTQWGRTFVGVDDGVAEMVKTTHWHQGTTARMLLRSAHVDDFGPSRVDDVRVRVKRGLGAHTDAQRPQIGVRMIRDNRHPSAWVWRDLGAPGERDLTLNFGGFGFADTWQMEVAVTDNVPVQFTRAQVYVQRARW